MKARPAKGTGGRKLKETPIKWPAKYAWLHEYLLQKNGAELEHKLTWNAFLYRLHGKIFALLLRNNQGEVLLNLKCDPMLSIEFREQYKGVQPGWHMNKVHWISLYLKTKTPDDAVRELVDISYDLIAAALPKKVREELGIEVEL